jgi:chromosomal replication initiator protein
MKTTDLAILWKKVLGEIKKNVSKGTYAGLFLQTHLISLEGNIATIGVPSVILINLLQSRYLQEIKKHIDLQTGEDISVVFMPSTFPVTDKKLLGEAPLFEGLAQEETGLGKGAVENREKLNDLHKTNNGKSEGINPFLRMPIGHLPRVRAEYTFDSFAVSSTNQLAFVSSQNVAGNIGGSYNPFFVYGPVGVGKTHLMHAIANYVYRQQPEKKIIYITSEEFTNEVVEAIRHNETAKMKRRFRSAYLLLIDDIQFIAGKDKVQEELFHTFNILIDNGSQIVLSSDRPPEEIKKLEKRLSSRFAGGLTVDIEAPDFELKAAITLIKARKYGYDLSIDVAKMLAETATDTRSLEGLLLRIVTQAKNSPSEREIDIELAKEALSGKIEERHEHIHADDVIKYVCDYYRVKSTQIKGPKRDAGLVRARQVAMYILKERLQLTQVEIGNLLGGRDHTTVMHGVDKIKSLVENMDVVGEDIRRITKQFDG